MVGGGATNAHNRLIEALLPADEEDAGMDDAAIAQAEGGTRLEIRDSDTGKFTWHIYYACALANAIDIHLSTLERRRIDLAARSSPQQDAVLE
jgi:hypothetical protein